MHSVKGSYVSSKHFNFFALFFISCSSFYQHQVYACNWIIQLIWNAVFFSTDVILRICVKRVLNLMQRQSVALDSTKNGMPYSQHAHAIYQGCRIKVEWREITFRQNFFRLIVLSFRYRARLTIKSSFECFAVHSKFVLDREKHEHE